MDTLDILKDVVSNAPVVALLAWMVMEERRDKRRAQVKLEECQEDRLKDARADTSGAELGGH